MWCFNGTLDFTAYIMYNVGKLRRIATQGENMTRKTHNYLNNKDLLVEIHRSKISYCQYKDDAVTQYDTIISLVPDFVADGEITFDEIFSKETIENAKEAKAKRLSLIKFNDAYTDWENNDGKASTKPKAVNHKISPDDIDTEGLIVRIHTFEHIPLDLERKKTHRRPADKYKKVNFIPFKHYIVSLNYSEDATYTADLGDEVVYLTEVLVSHINNDGEFDTKHGCITDKLSRMYMELVNRYSEKSNWRGYTFKSEMIGASLLQFSSMGLQFNEMKSDNPFSYYTQFAKNSFTKVLNDEKVVRDIRDDLLIEAGQNPSSTRQLQIEEEIRIMRGDFES